MCAHILCGHNSPVTTISYATDLDIVLSGSQSGLLCLHSVRNGNFIRSITHIIGTPIDIVLATSPGYLVAHSWSNQNMHVFWINGQHRATVRTATRWVTSSYTSLANFSKFVVVRRYHWISSTHSHSCITILFFTVLLCSLFFVVCSRHFFLKWLISYLSYPLNHRTSSTKGNVLHL